jgi:hypothetical protein
MIKWFFVFASINTHVETSSLHPWDEGDLVMTNDPSDTLLDLVCHYFIEAFCFSVP